MITMNVYEQKRAKLLKDLRDLGVEQPSRLYRKVGVDSWDDQIDRMQAHVASRVEQNALYKQSKRTD